MNWRDVGFLVLGLFVGSNFGLLIFALISATGDRGQETGNEGPEMEDGGRRVVFERRTMISKRCAAPPAPTPGPVGWDKF